MRAERIHAASGQRELIFVAFLGCLHCQRKEFADVLNACEVDWSTSLVKGCNCVFEGGLLPPRGLPLPLPLKPLNLIRFICLLFILIFTLPTLLGKGAPPDANCELALLVAKFNEEEDNSIEPLIEKQDLNLEDFMKIGKTSV